MYLDEISDVCRDIRFQLWFVERLAESDSEMKKKIRESDFDMMVEFRDHFKKFMLKWDLIEFWQEYQKENGVFDAQED